MLADCDTHAEKLQQELKETKEFAAKLQAALDDNTRVESLKQALKEKTELADQLKVALESKQRENKTLEESSLEANSSLEERIKKDEEYILNLRQEKISLERGLDFAKQLNTRINDTKEQAQNNLQTISLQNKKTGH